MNENTNHNGNSKGKSIAFWAIFIIILGLIIWGLVAANGKSSTAGSNGVPNTLPSPVTASDWSLGTSTAAVTLVEYADFECPSCQSYYPILKQLFSDENANGANRLFFVYRYFPLPQHSDAIIAAEAAQAAGEIGGQNAFWAMHDLLFGNYSDWENLSDPSQVFVGYAAKIGISTTTFLADLTSPAVDKVVSDSYQADTSAGLNYTPTLFINGTRIDNPADYPSLKALVDAAASSSASTNTSTTTAPVSAE